MPFDMGSFAGGMGNGLQQQQQQAMLRQLMTRQQPPMQQQGMMPGYEDPSQQMSVAGPADFASLQQQPGFMDMLKRIMMGLGGGGQ
jgi:hypothetical protein